MEIPNSEELNKLIDGAFSGEKYALAKLISLIEKQNSLPIRKLVFGTLDSHPRKGNTTIGITGSPGAGKSSLIGEICKEFLNTTSSEKMAVIAIDPSSSISGGSILGDRTRITIPSRENRIYFRSQASQLELGGVNPYTFHVLRLLRYFFDLIIIETVGIGQNEIEVSKLADFSYLVLQPLGGDQVQFMKSGIMEVPDSFIINKCDEKELANSSYHMLLNSLEFLKETLGEKKHFPNIFLCSVVKKIGITEISRQIFQSPRIYHRPNESKLQLEKWVKNEFGNRGLEVLKNKFPNPDYEKYEEIEGLYLDFMNGIIPPNN